jgi:hypothetical protein
MIEAKAFRTFITMYSLLKSERLSANIKLALHKTLITPVMTYVYAKNSQWHREGITWHGAKSEPMGVFCSLVDRL